MAKLRVEQFFDYRAVSPSSLQQDNIIHFSYRSPDGVHDRKPLVLVVEKRGDRIFGLNLHYDMNGMSEAVDHIQNRINSFLEESYFRKYPENKQKLREERKTFDKSLITEDEYKDFMRSFPRKELEVFLVQNRGTENLRCYLFQRMTSVSKLVWRV